MDDPEITGAEREVGFCKPPVEHQFKPGNPGRPKGTRNKLGERFLEALLADFEQAVAEGSEAGRLAIAKMRDEKPNEYARMIASILPKEIEGNLNLGIGDALDALD